MRKALMPPAPGTWNLRPWRSPSPRASRSRRRPSCDRRGHRGRIGPPRRRVRPLRPPQGQGLARRAGATVGSRRHEGRHCHGDHADRARRGQDDDGGHADPRPRPPRDRAGAGIARASLGPVFGIKGGAAGGGWSQVVPMEGSTSLHGRPPRNLGREQPARGDDRRTRSPAGTSSGSSHCGSPGAAAST